MKLASQLEMIYPQRNFIFSINDGVFLGVYCIRNKKSCVNLVLMINLKQTKC